VSSDDHPACGKRGLTVRPGDIRYHVVQNIETPQVPSPWGILADGDDPVTGEKVAGSMNIWTYVTDIAAQSLVDLVRYTNGELTTEEITNGKYVRDWASAAKLGASGAFPTMPKAELDARLAAASDTTPDVMANLGKKPLPSELRALLNTAKARVLDVEARSDVASPSLAKVQAAMNLARGTPVESALLNPAMLALSGAPAGAAMNGAALELASPLGLNNPLVRTRLHELRENALAKRGACILDEAPEPSSMTALADILAAKFPAAESESPSDRQARYGRMLTYVKRRFHYAVIAHEMGHSIGLRHNFVSSSAPLFYRPQYWQLRTKNGTVTTQCTEAVDDGSTCVGPRYWDPVTDEERQELIPMWMQSTVMDYAGDLSQDMIGLGITDFAAARFFYGDTVSVYSEPNAHAGTRVGTGLTLATDTFGGLIGIKYGVKGSSGQGSDDFHYSALQQNYQVIRNCYDAEAVLPADWSDELDGAFDPVLDGHVVSIDQRPTKCRQMPVDYVGFTALRNPTDTELNGGFYRGGPSVEDATLRTRVPYAFASDNWADLGNVSVLRHDNGADPYEQVQFLITTQEVRHILDNYRRGRTTFSVRGAADRSFSRYNIKLQGIAGGMGFFASIYNDIGLGAGYDFKTLWPYVVNLTARDNMIASTVAFDHFTRELSRPEPGEHYRRPAAFDDPVFRSASDPDDLFQAGAAPVELMIPNGATGYLRDVGFGGHLLENSMSSTNGDFDVEFIENAGSYYEKINTALLLAESEDRFVSQSRRDFYDARFRAVGLADVFPDGFRRMVANALTGDRSLLAPRVETDETGVPLLDARADESRDPLARLYPARPLGWVSLWPVKGPEMCFSRLGRAACTDFSRTQGFAPDVPASTAPVDPQIGWEVQKFFIAWTIALIKANEKTPWLDQMRLYRLGSNANPELESRIEWQDPTSGEIYYAKAFGTECLFGDPADSCAGGRTVQKGIAARVLEYANELTAKAYQL
ncbi:MAG TPA: zinc-dependent metalloprotease, partial [Polyangiaceae bacterium]